MLYLANREIKITGRPLVFQVVGLGLMLVQSQAVCLAQSAQVEYNQYRDQAASYENQLESSVQQINLDESRMKSREDALEKQIKHVPQLEKSKIFREIAQCRQEVEKDEAEKQQANSYMLRTSSYLQHLRANAQMEIHNANEDQELATEAAQKAQQAQAVAAWESRIASLHQQTVNSNSNVGYGGGGYGYRRGGRGYRNGNFYGYRSNSNSQPARGSTSFPSAHPGHH